MEKSLRLMHLFSGLVKAKDESACLKRCGKVGKYLSPERRF